MNVIRSVLLGMLLFSSQLGAVTTLDLPDIGDSTGALLSPEFERRLGQAFLNHVRRHTPILDDPEIGTYVQSIGYRLVSNSDNNIQQFTFFVINDGLINAFAAPGGIVGINAGVILNSQTESELAAVMAHEVAHVTQKHMARGAEAQSKMSLPMMAAMLGAILVATQNPEAGQAALVAIQGARHRRRLILPGQMRKRQTVSECSYWNDQILIRVVCRASSRNCRGNPVILRKLRSFSAPIL